MDSIRRATLASCGMIATGVAAAFLKPSKENLRPSDGVDLQTLVPAQFGQWRHEPAPLVTLVDPQTRQLLDKIYSQVLTRVYVGPGGYQVMLSIAYGSDQRGALQAHRPEVCYPAQGFQLRAIEDVVLRTPGGDLNVRRLTAELGYRREPVTYWFTVGESAALTALDRRVAELKGILSGRIPDGLLFRVSSIDADPRNAFARQASFIEQLLSAVPAKARLRLSGL